VDLDLFDIALNSGIRKNLDGHVYLHSFNSKKLIRNLEQNSLKTNSIYLSNILNLRNIFFKKESVISSLNSIRQWNCWVCPGDYQPDYSLPNIRETEKRNFIIYENLKKYKYK